LLNLTSSSPLAFEIRCKHGTLTTVGDAVALFSKLSDQQRERHYWKSAILMFGSALKEPRYLTTATLNLRTALAMDGLLEHD
jgi:hypothetical protein